MSRIPACCCGNSNTVIFSDLRAAGHTGIYSDTIQVGHCYPVSISIRLHLPSPPPQWFRKVKQWSKEGLKFFAGALPSANNMGDFSLQCVGVHFMTKNNCVKTLTLPHPCVRKSTTLVKRHDTARDRAQKSTRSPTFFICFNWKSLQVTNPSCRPREPQISSPFHPPSFSHVLRREASTPSSCKCLREDGNSGRTEGRVRKLQTSKAPSLPHLPATRSFCHLKWHLSWCAEAAAHVHPPFWLFCVWTLPWVSFVLTCSNLHSQLVIYIGERKFKLRSEHCLSSQESYSANEGKFQGSSFTVDLFLRQQAGTACPISLMLEILKLPLWCQGEEQPVGTIRGTVSLRDRSEIRNNHESSLKNV